MRFSVIIYSVCGAEKALNQRTLVNGAKAKELALRKCHMELKAVVAATDAKMTSVVQAMDCTGPELEAALAWA